MPTLASELRNKLERVVIEARDVAEAGAHAALEAPALAVHHHEPYPHMKPAQRELRNHLRARRGNLGIGRRSPGGLSLITLSASAPTSTGIGCCLPDFWPKTACS
jgi:hypothetical protein